MQKLRSLWKSKSQPKEQQSSSILEKTQNFFVTSFRRPSNTPAETTVQFDDYLTSLPAKYSSQPRNMKRKKSKTFNYSIRPELLKKCYQLLDPRYLDPQYEVNVDFFQKNRIISLERQTAMHEQLDQVQVCLFNQISSRFDEIMSVLLTIRSLECLVIQNQSKLSIIRQTFLLTMRQVTEKQKKTSILSIKKRNMQKTMAVIMNLKKYKKFIQFSVSNYNQSQFKEISNSTSSITKSDQQQDQNSNRQQLAIYFQHNLQIYKKLKCSSNIEQILESYQQDIRQNFSHQLNTRIYEYSCHLNPQKSVKQTTLGDADGYSQLFWIKLKQSRNIWQQSNNSNNNSMNNSMAVLDESVIQQSDDSFRFTVKVIIDQNIEEGILTYFNNCWTQGQFQASQLKKMYSNNMKNMHQQFLADFRDFCDQLCRDNQKNIDNPNLTNLLKDFSIQFCTKVYAYFVEIHKNILLRTFSLTCRFLKFAIKKAVKGQQLTIQQRYKLSLLVEGIIDLCIYLVGLGISKICDIIQLKYIHQGIDIFQFKNVIGVVEGFEEFIRDKLLPFIQDNSKCQQQNFLYELVHEITNKIPMDLLQGQKETKLQKYLGRLHKSSIQQELKYGLEEQKWQPVDIPTFYYDSLHFLMTGQSLNLRKNRNHFKHGASVNLGYETSVLADGNNDSYMMITNSNKTGTKLIADFRIIRNEIIIKNKMFKVTQTLLLLVELIEDYVLLGKTFPSIRKEVGLKLCELIRSYNTSSCQLIVYAGAMSLGKINSKNITARHLSLSALCVSFIQVLIECPPIKQLIINCNEEQNEGSDYKKLEQALTEHRNTIINKLYQILIHKVNSLQPTIIFVDPSKQIPTKGTQGIIYNIKIMYEILLQYFDDMTLRRIFTSQLLGLYLQAIRGSSINKIRTRIDAEGLKDDIGYFFTEIEAIGIHKLMGVENVAKYRVAAEQILQTVFEGISQFG